MASSATPLCKTLHQIHNNSNWKSVYSVSFNDSQMIGCWWGDGLCTCLNQEISRSQSWNITVCAGQMLQLCYSPTSQHSPKTTLLYSQHGRVIVLSKYFASSHLFSTLMACVHSFLCQLSSVLTNGLRHFTSTDIAPNPHIHHGWIQPNVKKQKSFPQVISLFTESCLKVSRTEQALLLANLRAKFTSH